MIQKYKVGSVFFFFIIFHFCYSQEYKRHLDNCKKYWKCYMKEKEMLQSARAAYKLAPTDKEVILWLGIALYQNHQYTEAIKHLEKAVELMPDNPYAHAHLAFAYAKWKAPEVKDISKETKYRTLCLKHINQALKLKPDYVDCYTAWGIGYHYSKMYTQAETLFKKAIKIDEKDPWPRVFLANTYLVMGDEEEADKEFEKALQLAEKDIRCGNKDAFVPRAIAIYYEANGKFDKALHYANIALSWNKKDVWFNEKLSVKRIIERIKKAKKLGKILVNEREEL